jgi:hypothetical protein
LRLFRKCKRKWFWRYIFRLKPKWTDTNLSIGTETHEALGAWYKKPNISKAAFKKRLAKQVKQLEANLEVASAYFDQAELDKGISLIKTFQGMVKGYIDTYQDDLEEWIVKPENVEREFFVPFKHYDFGGKIDLIPIIRKTGKVIIVEHKTASRIGDSYLERLPNDTQVRGYIFGAKEGLGLKPTEVLYDVIRKCQLRRKSDEPQDDFNDRIALDYASRPEFYFFRESLKFANDTIDRFAGDMAKTFDEYQFIINNHDPLDPESWVCSDHICTEYFKTCPYLPLCISGLDKGNGKLFNQSEPRVIEPVDED